MSELLKRTLSASVIIVVILGSILFSPWIFSILMLFVVSVGTFEMSRLQTITSNLHLLLGEIISASFFIITSLVALQIIPNRCLLLDSIFLLLPFLVALFSKDNDFKHVSAYLFGSLLYLTMPCSMMVFMYRQDLFGDIAGIPLLLLVFGLIWSNDVFAYFTGRLFGKHKLFPRISPGKTIEGSLGGLIFTILAICILNHYVSWLSIPVAVGFAIISVVFGTLGDLCESMLKRQAGVKDSGNLIPGHGGILDRFDSILFSVPFIFVYLLLI